MAHRSSVLLYVFSIATVLIFIFNYFRKISVIKRQLEHSPPKKIVEFGDGEIGAVSGCIQLHAPTLFSSLTKQECAYYSVSVRSLAGLKGRHYIPLMTLEKEGNSFLITDGTGYALVLMQSAECHFQPDGEYQYSMYKSRKIPLRDYFEKYKHRFEKHNEITPGMIFEEVVLSKDRKVTVYGRATRHSSASLGLSLPVDQVLVFASHADEQIYLF